MLLAITINPGHTYYHSNLQDTLKELVIDFAPDYLDLVNHSNDHYHGLISIKEGDEPRKTMFHFEPIRNIKAYTKYMYDHDLVDSVKFGELPFTENDSMIDYIIDNGPVKAVRKYGMQALRIYKQIKDFYTDLKIEKMEEKNNGC